MTKLARIDAEAIQEAHDRLGHRNGWRFLYGPIATLTEARVAFIGINPGGATDQSTHGRYSVEGGSAFTDEVWPEGAKRAPGTSPLQTQVRALFSLLGVDPTEVLAGNLVPFRSSREGALRAAAASERYGFELWRAVFEQHVPPLIITHGKTPSTAIQNMLGAYEPKIVPTGWGRTTGTRWRLPGGHLVCLPHLSTFKLLSRAQCLEPLKELLDGGDVCSQLEPRRHVHETEEYMESSAITPAMHLANIHYLQECGVLTAELHSQLHHSSQLGWSRGDSLESHIRYCKRTGAFRPGSCNASYAAVIQALADHVKKARSQGRRTEPG